MIDGKNFFDQPIKSEFKTYENIRKIATGKGGGYTTGCLLNYSYFKENCEMIAIDLSKQQHLILIQGQFNKSSLLEIWTDPEIQQCFSLLKKQKKLS